MIKDLVQAALDGILYEKNIYTFSQRKMGGNYDEYVVYTVSGDNKEAYADDKVMTKSADVTVKYYYRADMLNDYESMKAVKETEDLIENVLEAAGFEIPFGRFDAGDIEDIGYLVTIFECEYWRAV